MKKGLIILCLIVALIVLFFIFIKPKIICAYSPHLRTHIFTQKCEFAGGACPEPWYYKEGCRISKEQGIAIIKEDLGSVDKICASCFKKEYEGICDIILGKTSEGMITCSDFKNSQSENMI